MSRNTKFNNKIINLRHYCLTVKNLEKSLNFYKTFSPQYVSPLSIERGPLIDILFKKNFFVKSVHVHFTHENRLELLEVGGGEGRERILKKNSTRLFEGFHHICFTVQDIKKQLKLLENNSGKLIGKIIKIKKNNTPKSKKALHCYVKDNDGNIIQLAQDL